MLLLPATTAPRISPSSSTGIPAFPLCIYLEKQTTPPLPKTEPTNFTEATLRGQAPAVPATGHPRTTSPTRGHQRRPLVPEAAQPKAACSFPRRVGGWVQRTDRQTMAQHRCPAAPYPGQSPPGGGRSRGRAAGQHECWRRRHRGARNGDKPGGSAGGPRHGGPAALQGKCWETWGTQASRNKLRKINQKGNCGVGSTSPCPPAAGSAGGPAQTQRLLLSQPPPVLAIGSTLCGCAGHWASCGTSPRAAGAAGTLAWGRAPGEVRGELGGWWPPARGAGAVAGRPLRRGTC